ncbi:hypothetical protein [Streptomyces sp. SCUT-3]|uniref:hypothetical protein n=1 Tax=Streptomyces sp. SCUT-3 TaxID=2684469 RepID=UPI0021752911|nr:hypothetical protein [Streptomyces sp. SCUT-3]
MGAGVLDEDVQAGQDRSASVLFCSTSMTWNSGLRDIERAGLRISTSRSNGVSWWA